MFMVIDGKITPLKMNPNGIIEVKKSKVPKILKVVKTLNSESSEVTKVCSKCKKLKTTFSFSNRGKNNTKLRASCKLCEKEARLERDAMNKAIRDELCSSAKL